MTTTRTELAKWELRLAQESHQEGGDGAMRIGKAVTMLDSVSNVIGIYRAKPDVVLIPTNSLDGVRVWIRGNRNIILPQWSPRKDDLTATNWTILKKSNKVNIGLSNARKYTREEWRHENEKKA